MKSQVLKIDELILDTELYPRMQVGWQTAYQYAQAMRVGDVFPPIMVGKFTDKLYLIDGWHRVRAKQLLKENHIQGIVKAYDRSEDMFLDAIKLNISHGRPISTQEKVRIVHKLQEMTFELDEISKIVKIPMDKIELFQERTIIGPDGKPVYLKSVVARAEADKESLLNVDQERLSTRTIADLLEQLIELIESGVFSVEDEKVKALAIRLYGLLGEKLEL